MNSEFGSLTSTTPEAWPTRRPRPAFEQRGWQDQPSTATGSISPAQRVARDLQRHLITLEADFLEDYGSEINAGSRAGLLRFIREHAVALRPSIGAEPSGHIVATWRDGPGCLSLRFVDAFRFHFALTEDEGPCPRRVWGTAHVLTFLGEHPRAKRIITA
jgi:hypothetical protein